MRMIIASSMASAHAIPRRSVSHNHTRAPPHPRNMNVVSTPTRMLYTSARLSSVSSIAEKAYDIHMTPTVSTVHNAWSKRTHTISI